VGHLITLLFRPPTVPPIELPMPAKLIPGVKIAIGKAFELAYYRGVYDGLIAGAIITLLFLPSLRKQLAKGVSNAVDHF
jgi:hypothetical protein